MDTADITVLIIGGSASLLYLVKWWREVERGCDRYDASYHPPAYGGVEREPTPFPEPDSTTVRARVARNERGAA